MIEMTAADIGLKETGEKKAEAMSPGFALFNLHVNKAGERAFALLDQHFKAWADEVRELEKEGNGIMHVMNVEPRPATAAFVALVTAFVNEDRL